MAKKDTEQLLSNLEDISKAFVLIEPEDVQSLAQIHTKLCAISNEGYNEFIDNAAVHLAKIVEKIILNETADKQKDFEEISKTLSEMKILAKNGGKPENLDNGRLENPQSEICNTSAMLSTGLQSEIFNLQSAIPTIPSNTDDEILKNFLARQDSVMEEMEALTLDLEKKMDTGKMDALRRIIHTLKGEAGVLAMDDVQELCHKCEDYLTTSKEKVPVEYLLTAKDWLLTKFNAMSGKSGNPVAVDVLLKKLADMVSGKPAGNKPASASGNVATQPEPHKILKFEPEEITDASLAADFINEAREHLHNADNCLLILEKNPKDTEAVNAIFRAFHTIKGVANFLSFKGIGTLAHTTENALDLVRKNELMLNRSCLDLMFTAVDAMKHEMESLHTALSTGTQYQPSATIPGLIESIKLCASGQTPAPKVGEILLDEGKITRSDINKALQEQQQKPTEKIGEILVAQGAVTAADVSDALEKQKSTQKVTEIRETIKVDTERLDRLVDTIGELVIAEAMVTHDNEVRQHASTKVTTNLRQLDKITRELQSIGMSMRLVSIKSTFQKMARLVHDLARKAGKEINFETTGEDTELDKTVIEHIGDPLVHMVRNAADHGVESPEERVKAGKPRAGTLRLRAFQKGGGIYIEISDDGKGLNKDAILKKARKQGLISENQQLTEQEMYQMIFRPGFSTAEKVTDVSGRGVGMDVVKRNIELLRGQVEISSTPGKGTVFTIRLPLTLAIVDGMIVKVGSERFIVPTLSVIESFRPAEKDLSSAFGEAEMVMVHNHLLPLFRLSQLFTVENALENPQEGVVMVIEDMGKKVGLLVDSIIDQQQTVIKNLGSGVGKVQGVSGGAIMSDGKISLIIDVAGIVRMACGEKKVNAEEMAVV